LGIRVIGPRKGKRGKVWFGPFDIELGDWTGTRAKKVLIALNSFPRRRANQGSPNLKRGDLATAVFEVPAT